MAGTVRVKVWGDYACFTRPEMKVERVTYPVMTPSAARGILEAIFWRPEFRYRISRIGVLKLGRQMVILRNEICDRQGRTPIFVEDKRQQRSSLVLKDVAYIIEGEMVLRPHATEPLAKYLDMFERRIKRGQYFHTPYLGTREFPAYFDEVREEDTPPPIQLSIGPMLLDVAYVEDKNRREFSFRKPGKSAPVSGYAQAVFFQAEVQDGWLHIPKEKYDELWRLEERSCSTT